MSMGERGRLLLTMCPDCRGKEMRWRCAVYEEHVHWHLSPLERCARWLFLRGW